MQIFFNRHIVVFQETSVLKEVRILRYLQSNSAVLILMLMLSFKIKLSYTYLRHFLADFFYDKNGTLFRQKLVTFRPPSLIFVTQRIFRATQNFFNQFNIYLYATGTIFCKHVFLFCATLEIFSGLLLKPGPRPWTWTLKNMGNSPNLGPKKN